MYLFATDHPEFMNRAACHGLGDLFYAETKDEEAQMREAKRVCASCAVRLDCLSYALERRERHGVWGGLTAYERQTMHKREHKNSSIDRVEIERVVEVLLFDNQKGFAAYQKLNAFEKAIVIRILVHQHRWTQTMIRRHLRMNGASAATKYHAALDAGDVNLLKEIA